MRILRLLAAAALLVAAMTIASSPVAAKSGDVVKTGSCTGSADWKLKAGKDNGRIEVEFEVDSNHNGQVWRVKLIDNGVLRHRGRHTTHGAVGLVHRPPADPEHGRTGRHRRPGPQPLQRPALRGQADDLTRRRSGGPRSAARLRLDADPAKIG